MKLGLLAIFGLIGSVLLAGCATAPGGTVASPILQSDVTNTIMLLDMAADRECKHRKVVNTVPIEVRPDAKSVVERWSVDRCGKTVNYRVTLSTSPRGGTDFAVQAEQ